MRPEKTFELNQEATRDTPEPEGVAPELSIVPTVSCDEATARLRQREGEPAAADLYALSHVADTEGPHGPDCVIHEEDALERARKVIWGSSDGSPETVAE
jgi:hypothetical protein